MLRTLIRVISRLLATLALLLALAGVHLYLEGRPQQGRPDYVAMGSSFAAGPAVTESAENSPWFCARSRDNYAQQLARLRHLSLVDVSCSGATTRHVLEGGQLMQSGQIEAVSEETRLVTITIGGNDIGYLANLMAMACDASTPWYLSKSGLCRVRTSVEMRQSLGELPARLAAIVSEIRRRAPKAMVIFVNYQTVLPESGTCERLGLTAMQVSEMREVAAELNRITQQVAQSARAWVFDAAAISRGHDVCAQESWINPMHPPRGLRDAPLHPTLAGMTAIAHGLNALLEPVGR